MDFTLDKKHEMARQLFRDFAEKEVKPLAIEVDETEEFPRVTVDKMIKAVFMGIPVPKEYGGQGCDPLTYAMSMIASTISRPIRSPRARGPMGWFAPSFIAVSISSTLATPSA